MLLSFTCTCCKPLADSVIFRAEMVTTVGEMLSPATVTQVEKLPLQFQEVDRQDLLHYSIKQGPRKTCKYRVVN